MTENDQKSPKYWHFFCETYMHGSILYFFLKLSFRKLVGIFSQNFRPSSYPIVKELNDVQMIPFWKKNIHKVSQFPDLTKPKSTEFQFCKLLVKISIFIDYQILANGTWLKFKFSLSEICQNQNLPNFWEPEFHKNYNFDVFK